VTISLLYFSRSKLISSFSNVSTDLLLLKRSTPKNPAQSHCPLPHTTAKWLSLTNPRPAQQVLRAAAFDIIAQCSTARFVIKRVLRLPQNAPVFFCVCLVLFVSHSVAAPLAGGGGASVIINVSSDTQIQVTR
jgi:hypothetical protein